MLLAGIMGHNLCVDIFGGPSDAEAAAGMTPHGEASVVRYELNVSGETITTAAVLPGAGLRVEREIALVDRTVRIRESIENLTVCDRPIGWTQHVTLGPPFLESGLTEFRASATRSKVYEHPFGVADDLAGAALFDWPFAPRTAGGVADLRRFTDVSPSSAYTAHLMSATQQHAFFVAFSPTVASGLRLRVDARRFSVARYLAGKSQPDSRPVERRHSGVRHGIRRLADARDAARNDRSRSSLRHPDVSLDSGESPCGGRLLGDRVRCGRRARNAHQPDRVNS